MRLFSCAILMLSLCAGASCAVAQTPALPMRGLPPLVVPQGLGVNIKSSFMSAEELDKLAAAGFRVVRFDLPWNIVETSKGQYEFAKGQQNFDRLVDETAKRGIRVLYIMAYGNALYCDKGDKGEVFGPYTPEQRKAFANYAAAAAKHFAGKGVIFEIWNEPNHANFWKTGKEKGDTPSQLWSELAKVVIPAMRQADPNATIVGPALSGPSQGEVFDANVVAANSMNFLKDAAATGVLQQLDAVSIHAYRDWWPETFLVQHEEIRKLFAQYKVDRPLFNGEQGWATWFHWGAHGGKGRMSEQGNGLRWPTRDQQASYLVRNYLMNQSLGMPITVWYCWPEEDMATPPPHLPNNMGMGLMDRGGNPKQNYFAAKAMSEVLAGYSFVERVRSADPQDWLLKFKKNDATIVVVWAEEGQPLRPVPRPTELPAVPAKVVDLYGNVVQLSPGSRTLGLTNEPQYVLDAAAAKGLKLSAPAATLSAAAADQPVENGSFEQDMAGWRFDASGNAQSTVKLDKAVTHSGKQSACVTNTSAYGPNVYGWLHQALELKPNTTYRITAWVKGQRVGKVFFGSFEKRQYLPEGDFDWRHVSVEFKTGDKPAFELTLLTESPTGAVWIDDIVAAEVK